MMKKIHWIVTLVVILFASCKSNTDDKKTESKLAESEPKTFRIAIGSCNRQDLPQEYWSIIEKDSADIFVWGGDNIYADTPDMGLMGETYDSIKSNLYYQSFIESLPNAPLGVWDDHDYGKNDAGKEWPYKDEAKELFLDFLDIDSTQAVANRKGTYYSKVIPLGSKSIKFYMLDSRYFRDGLVDAEVSGKRYQPHTSKDSTLLGEQQWEWLEKEFKSSKANFNIIVSSIQFLSSEHGFETWGNFPNEIEKMQNLWLEYPLQNILLFSGDRHISEFSQKKIDGLAYPLTDFTSSGLTHSYSSYSGEPNRYRVGEVVAQTSYGIIDLNLVTEEAELKIKSTTDGHTIRELHLDF